MGADWGERGTPAGCCWDQTLGGGGVQGVETHRGDLKPSRPHGHSWSLVGTPQQVIRAQGTGPWGAWDTTCRQGTGDVAHRTRHMAWAMGDMAPGTQQMGKGTHHGARITGDTARGRGGTP